MSKKTKITMTIDYNNIRIRALTTYNELCNKLQEHINLENIISINMKDIIDIMADLRLCLIGIGNTHIEGDDNCKSIVQEVRRKVESKNIKIFKLKGEEHVLL